MRSIIAMVAALIGLLGCRSGAPVQPVASDFFNEKAIYASLKKEPVPVPKSTPYDTDVRQRQLFTDGFRDGWERGISGALLHGTFDSPAGIPNDMRKVWVLGWKSGAKMGGDRWMEESERLIEEKRRQDGAANGSQLIRSETNQSSSAAGSRR